MILRRYKPICYASPLCNTINQYAPPPPPSTPPDRSLQFTVLVRSSFRKEDMNGSNYYSKNKTAASILLTWYQVLYLVLDYSENNLIMDTRDFQRFKD